MPNSFATRSPDSFVRLATAENSMPDSFWNPGMCRSRVFFPAPTNPTRIALSVMGRMVSPRTTFRVTRAELGGTCSRSLLRLLAVPPLALAGAALALGASALVLASGPPDLDLGARREPGLTVGDPALAALESFGDDGLVALGARGDDRLQVDGGVRLHHEDVRALLSALDRGGRDDDGVRLGGQGERDVGELAGPEPSLRVGERRLQSDRARGRVDRVVDEGHHAGDGTRLACGHDRDLQRPGRHVALDPRELLLRHRER